MSLSDVVLKHKLQRTLLAKKGGSFSTQVSEVLKTMKKRYERNDKKRVKLSLPPKELSEDGQDDNKDEEVTSD